MHELDRTRPARLVVQVEAELSVSPVSEVKITQCTGLAGGRGAPASVVGRCTWCERSLTFCFRRKRMISSEKGPCTSGRIESVKQYMASAVRPNSKTSPYREAIARGLT